MSPARSDELYTLAPEAKSPEILNTAEINIPEGSLVLLIGLPGSGKSTFANKHFPQEYIVSADTERQALTNNPANQAISEKAFEVVGHVVSSRLRHGKTVVVDAQNLDPAGRNVLTKHALRTDSPVIAIHFDIEAKELLARERQRTKSVGGDYLAARLQTSSQNIRNVERDPNIDVIYRLKTDQVSEAVVPLPEEDAQLLAEDVEFAKSAQVAEIDLFERVKQVIEREQSTEKADVPRIIVPAGSVNFLPEGEASTRFLENNVIPSQVVSLEWLGRRMGTELNDPAVYYAAKLLIDTRERANLTTFVTYPEEASRLATRLHKEKSANARLIEDPPEILEKAMLEVDRASENVPLLILGDVHGCYTALKTHIKNLHRENLDLPADGEKRKMLFVGDIADRGPFNAETVILATSLVRQREAVLVKGNHDENLATGLKEIIRQADAAIEGGVPWESWARSFSVDSLRELVRSGATRETLQELLIKEEGGEESVRLKLSSLKKIHEVFDSAPTVKNYKHLVAVHASLRRVPQDGTVFDKNELKEHTHGIRSYSGQWKGRAEIRPEPHVIAKDPDIVVVSGHTHRQRVEQYPLSGTVNLDVDGGNQGKIHGMYWGGEKHMQLASAEEPSVLELYEQLTSGELPEGEKLNGFLNYLESQEMIEVKAGAPGSVYEDLRVISYSQLTELQSLWERYPVLRNFRGLIVDKDANIVARPFNKTHKAGVEVPLEELTMQPDKVFEKANGSMGICYFWQGEWRVATKFSFDNEGYTKPATEMLNTSNTSGMNPDNTYLFEIILPEDSHIVDYHGEKKLILLNARNKSTGAEASWHEVQEVAKGLPCSTAEDMTEKFSGMTVAQIYEFAQQPGNLQNIEGLMAQYIDPSTGEKITVKVKTREYDDKKFVRDRLKWDKLLDSFDWDIRRVRLPNDRAESLLGYNLDNLFARSALEVRADWVRTEYSNFIRSVQEIATEPWVRAQEVYDAEIAAGTPLQEAQAKAMRDVVPVINAIFASGSAPIAEAAKGGVFGFVRGLLTAEPGSPEIAEAYNVLSTHAKDEIQRKIDAETQKRGRAAYWLIPE